MTATSEHRLARWLKPPSDTPCPPGGLEDL